MLYHVGTQKIETERLILRKFETIDAKDAFKNWMGDPENVKYLGWRSHENFQQTLDTISKWTSLYNKKNYYKWAIVLKETEEVIGQINVILILEHVDCMELGYVLSKKYWNNGIMTETLKAVQSYLFSKVNCHRIQARHDMLNLASGKVMINVGMQFEGILRQSGKNNSNEWIDAAIYSII